MEMYMDSKSIEESTRLVSSNKKRRKKKFKKVTIVVCSSHGSSKPDNVAGLIKHIQQHFDGAVGISASVSFKELPYNVCDMNKFNLRGIDVLLLCHSIQSRGFSLTDVPGYSLYDSFLPRAKRYLGKSKVGVIAHDFPERELQPEVLFSRMDTFRCAQSTAFKCADLVMIGGQLSSEPVGLNTKQLNELHQFFCQAFKSKKNIFLRCIITCGCCACTCAWKRHSAPFTKEYQLSTL